MVGNEKISAPNISLPKGGGAIKGIGETFQPNPFTGTGNLSIPIYTTPCRDFEPRLSLDYSSGSGNSTFGVGFSLSIPNIARKTEKGLPKYQDLDSDTFIISNAEDLVPKLVEKEGQWVADEDYPIVDDVPYLVKRFRPRTEGLFARIELWMNLETGDIYWEVISKEGIKNIYGRKANAKIKDPDNPARIFEWLLEETSNSKGNKILYEYKSEDEKNVPNDINEAGRRHAANKYIKRIKYGNYFDQDNNEKWAFEVVFDYGEHDLNNEPYNETLKWPEREDSFSSYKPGFEIRTHRLCRRILMFHHFDELGDEPCLVRSTDFEYEETPLMTFLKAVHQKGYKSDNGSYDVAEMPPLEFAYSTFDPEEHTFKPLSVETGDPIPGLINQSEYMMVDLYGEGISGILYSDGSTVLYWRGKGNGTFAESQPAKQFPIEKTITSPHLTLMDLGGDGKLDLVISDPGRAGYYQSNPDGTWEPLKLFESYPVDFQNPNKEMVDLNGDGFADLLLLENEYLLYHPSRGKKGYGDPIKLVREYEDTIPASNSSREEALRFADMFGDGLQHRVRIRNGIVECWPNHGYGRFGKRVLFGNAPRFDEKMDSSRLFLADIDGSGTTDFIYVYKDRINVYFNRSGNSFSDPVSIFLPQGFDNLDHVQVADVLGNGTSCLVLTNNKPGLQHDYYDFTGGVKPHLLVEIINNMGATTRIRYSSSTKFYLEDEENGNPWISRLPFPVYVIEKTETIDRISGSKLVTVYKYHHGFYDGEDREFRGFGCVEQWDSESFEQFSEPRLLDVPFEVVEEGLHVPPMCTKTWYHTGAHEKEGVLSQQYVKEYYKEDPKALLLPDSVFESYDEIDVESMREAYRAFKGQVLRQETYAEDGKPGLSEHPYTVTEANFTVRLLQPKAGQNHAVFFVYPHESITYHYERSNDPRIGHQFTLEVDKYGNTCRSCTVYYPRREVVGRHIHPEQAQTKATATLNEFINETEDFYLLGIPYESKQFEIGGLNSQNTYFTFEEIEPKVGTALKEKNIIRFDQTLSHQQLQSRLLSWQRHYYWDKDQDITLSLGSVTEQALLHHSEEAVFSVQQVQEVFGEKVTDNVLENEGGYKLAEGYWWNPGLIQHYKGQNKFYVPSATEDPFGEKTEVEYDNYCLASTKVIDPLDNITEAEIDYRTLMPLKVIDLNDNVSEVLFDALTLVKVTSVYGEENGEPKGDLPVSQYEELTVTELQDVLDEPHGYVQKATSYFYYDLFAWKNRGEPAYALNLLRETHTSELSGTAKSEIQFHIGYSDGFGREIQKKVKVEHGKAFLRDSNGNLIRDEAGDLVEGMTDNRWLVSGRTVYNNKGKPVKQYEPFYSSTANYEPEKELTEFGVTPIIHYDPLLRVVRTDTPKKFFSKVEFTPWIEERWDENDTVADSEFYMSNINNNSPEFKDEKDALEKAFEHYNTPQKSVLNNVGNRFLLIEKNVNNQQLITYYELDIQGNELSITDPRQYNLNKTRSTQEQVKNFVHIFDMTGTVLSIDSVDAGLNLTLNNTLGQPIHTWDSREFHVKTVYDGLQRPLEVHVEGNDLNQTVEKMIYGESQPNDKEKNLRGELIKYYDQAGILYFDLFDIKGEPRINRRQLRKEYKNEVNWENLVDLEGEYMTEYTYDALGRTVLQKNPDKSIYKPEYHQSGLLKKVEVTFEDDNPTLFVENIGYNAKGQRKKIEYGNGVITEYSYEKETFRLKHLKTCRNQDKKLLQDIFYTYDPVENITRIIDNSHKGVFHNQNLVEPLCDYTYDALYQLIRATGRQHPALTKDNYQISGFKQSQYLSIQQVHPNDQKLVNYRETYTYDESRNLTKIRHTASAPAPSWTRDFVPSETSNRTIPQEMLQGDTADNHFDENGNLIELEHLRDIEWNYRDNIASVDLIKRYDAPSDSEYYVYNSEGSRVRKVFEQYIHEGSVIEIVEKIYLGNCEIKRIKQKTDSGITTIFERKTLHVLDDERRIALIHHWTKDDLNRETENVEEKKIQYQLSNHLGSCSLELSSNAEIISYEEHFPYGGTAFIAGKNKKEVKAKEYRYSGKERDDWTGLYYFGARYYAPWMGRWMSCDSAMDLDGTNLYRYVRNNPINLIDPNGEKGKPPKSFRDPPKELTNLPDYKPRAPPDLPSSVLPAIRASTFHRIVPLLEKAKETEKAMKRTKARKLRKALKRKATRHRKAALKILMADIRISGERKYTNVVYDPKNVPKDSRGATGDWATRSGSEPPIASIGDQPFRNIIELYRTVRHEMWHLEQRHSTQYDPSFDPQWPKSHPGRETQKERELKEELKEALRSKYKALREFKAYLLDLENRNEIGLTFEEKATSLYQAAIEWQSLTQEWREEYQDRWDIVRTEVYKEVSNYEPSSQPRLQIKCTPSGCEVKKLRFIDFLVE